MDSTLLVLFLAGLITGFSKFSVGGMGLLVLPIVMIAYPGPEALGVLLPLYIVTDVMAIMSYRKQINRAVLLRLLPLAFLGILIGSQLLANIKADQFVTLLGVIIVAMLALGIYLDHRPAMFMQKPFAAYTMGFFGGMISMISNASGPIFSLFLLEQKLPKESYVSTRTWAFFLVNLVKLPMYIGLGLLSHESLMVSAQTLPGLLVGALIGYRFLQKVSPTQFKLLIRVMSTLAAMKLFLFS